MRAVMIQGAGSNVGKSMLVAGLCRALVRRGLVVRPFKPQNMSNNAAVTEDGGEIGRAQALQALACGVAPHTDMNPVLLKPESETGSQIIVQGRRWGSAKARDYAAIKPQLMAPVLDSFHRLAASCDIVLVEGAGSPAEVNLRANDIAKLIAQRTGWRGLGVVPWFAGAHRLPAEDALDIADTRHRDGLKIVCLQFSRIANFDDLDPLAAEPGVSLTMLRAGEVLPGDADLVILPGSKSTRADLAFLRVQGWDIDLAAHHRRGGRILGLCGGYQMLGRTIADPDGLEGPAGTTPGLGLLDLETTMTADKRLTRVQGTHAATGCAISGYEIHLGRSDGPARTRPFAHIEAVDEGAVSADGRVMGTYLHGLFSEDAFRSAFLAGLGLAPSGLGYAASVDRTLDELADHLEQHIDIDAVLALSARL
jgi:adenosylcobyric acid synthase